VGILSKLHAVAIAIGIVIVTFSAPRGPAWAVTTGDASETQQGAVAIDQEVFTHLIVMRPEEIARQAGQIWTLTRILPKPYVPKPPGEIRVGPKPGETHFIPHLVDRRRMGIVAIVSDLIGQSDCKVYDYSFVPPMGGTEDVLLIARPFLEGGLCVCQIDGTKSGIDRFSPLYLIPDGWCDSLATAFRSLQARAGPHSSGQSAADGNALRQFAMGTNPLLALTAYRLLLVGGQADDRLAEWPLEVSDPMEQSVLLYLLFSHLRDAWWPRIMDRIRQMVKAAVTAEQLQSLQLAAEFAWPLDPFRPPIENHCQEILKCLQARAGALGSQSPGAEYLRRFLHARGMDPEYASGPGPAAH
jgi:hypothetical protein